MNYQILFIFITVIGLIKIIINSYHNIRMGKYSLDYIAFLAMALALYSQEYIAGTVIAIMYIGGQELEKYASRKAHSALKNLGDTIPKSCLIEKDGAFEEIHIQDVKEGQIIIIKNNEIIPLDGFIISPDETYFNLSNLTGEAGPVTLKKGTFVKSGSVNIGETMKLGVVGDFSSSTYQKIVGLVEEAKAHPAPVIRISEEANLYFTAISLSIAIITYILTGDITRLLAVLVIATPCPLIIAAPIAFVSGMSRLARVGIILRKPSALEGIDRASAIFFDKTGTLTLGEPVLSNKDISDEMLVIAAGLEIHSLHPLARTIVNEARRRNIHFTISEDVKEEIGKGISGTINGERYSLFGVSLSKEGIEIERFHFDDVLKEGATDLVLHLKKQGIRTAIITGDKEENARRIFGGNDIDIYADQSPEEKYSLIEKEKIEGKTVVMVGDGINDAPALTKADVGIVFSGTENGASIQAADVVVLGNGLDKLDTLFKTSYKTMQVAKQSIFGGISLSVIGMILAAFGFITPVEGALIQECIDIVVILNALRALT